MLIYMRKLRFLVRFRLAFARDASNPARMCVVDVLRDIHAFGYG